MTKPTPGDRARRKILKAIEARKGYPYTVRELAKRIGLSPSATHHHLLVLRQQRLVKWKPDSNRTLALTPDGAAHLKYLRDLAADQRGKVES